MSAQTTNAEEWREVTGFPAYDVSSLGRIRRAVTGKILTQQIVHGYCYVWLRTNGKTYSRRVNRLVCRAFHGEPPSPDFHAAHNDGLRSNNRSDNLRWADPAANMADKLVHGTSPTGDRNGARLYPDRLARGDRNGKRTKPECTPRGESHPSARFSNDEVRAIREDGRSRRAIASAYGVSKCAIDGIKTGKTWGHVA